MLSAAQSEVNLLFAKRFTIRSALGLCLLAPVVVPLWASELLPDEPDRTALTEAVFELQRDLLLTRQKYLPEENQGLAIYLDVDNLPQSRLDSIVVSLDDNVLAEEKFGPAQINRLDKGGMQKLSTSYIAPGKYLLKATLKTGNNQVNKTLELTKSAGRDNVRITITSFLQQHNPEITFAQETWAAAQ